MKSSDNAFYLRALPKSNWEMWYYKKAAERETLGNVVKKIMKKAQFDGHYTNNSLRRSCATRLYDSGVPEQLIQETTGHWSSDGVRTYKCTSSALKREASEILQGSLSKKAVTDVEKKDKNGAGENYIAQAVKVVSPEKCDQEGSNQSHGTFRSLIPEFSCATTRY